MLEVMFRVKDDADRDEAEEDDDVEEWHDVLFAQPGNVLVHIERDLVRDALDHLPQLVGVLEEPEEVLHDHLNISREWLLVPDRLLGLVETVSLVQSFILLLDVRQKVCGLIEVFPPQNVKLKKVLKFLWVKPTGCVLHPKDTCLSCKLDRSEQILVADDEPVEVGDVRIVDGVGDIVQGVPVHLVVPVEHLLDRLVPVLDLGAEESVLDLELQLRLQIVDLVQFGPVGDVLQRLVRCIERV